MKTVLGVDPGFDRMGIAVLSWGEKPTLLHSTCVLTGRDLERGVRLSMIRESIEATINTWHPEVLSLETLFFSTNKKTAVGVAEARGVIREVGSSLSLDLIEVSPQEVKLAATGYGRSSKEEVVRMVRFLISNAPEQAMDDEYDAIAIALAGGAKHRFPQSKEKGLA